MNAEKYHEWYDRQLAECRKHMKTGGDPTLFWSGRMYTYVQMLLNCSPIANEEKNVMKKLNDISDLYNACITDKINNRRSHGG